TELLRDALETVVFVEREIPEPVRSLEVDVVGPLVAQLHEELVAHFFERAFLAFAHLVEANDVPAEIRADGSRHLAELERVERLLERGIERAAADPTEIAARGRGAGIVGVLRRERREILAVADPREQLLGACARVVVAFAALGRDQDMARAPLLG